LPSEAVAIPANLSACLKADDSLYCPEGKGGGGKKYKMLGKGKVESEKCHRCRINDCSETTPIRGKKKIRRS